MKNLKSLVFTATLFSTVLLGAVHAQSNFDNNVEDQYYDDYDRYEEGDPANYPSVKRSEKTIHLKTDGEKSQSKTNVKVMLLDGSIFEGLGTLLEVIVKIIIKPAIMIGGIGGGFFLSYRAWEMIFKFFTTQGFLDNPVKVLKQVGFSGTLNGSFRLIIGLTFPILGGIFAKMLVSMVNYKMSKIEILEAKSKLKK